MDRAGSFTAISGTGAILVGFVAIVGSLISRSVVAPHLWIGCWSLVAFLAVGIFSSMSWRKARRLATRLDSALGRKFGLGLLPGLASGLVLTAALYKAGMVALLPGVWSLLYGVSVIGGGMFSVRVVPLTGLAFLVLGGTSLFLPGISRDLTMAVGFGGFHIIGGALIAKRYGG